MDTSKPKWIVESAHAAGWHTVGEDPGVFVRLAHPLDTRSVVVLFDQDHPKYAEHLEDFRRHAETLRTLGRAATRFLEFAGWRQTPRPPRTPFELSGAPPFGMRIERGQLVPDEREQAVIERIGELRTEGHSLRSICTILAEEGHRPRRAAQWRPGTLNEIIKRT
jgi:hypothetical protein